MGKYVIYTALFGDYDTLVEPKEKFKNVKYLCFTDQTELQSDIWEIKIVKSKESPVILNRKYKWLPHKYLQDYEYSIYIDANVELLKDPISRIQTYLAENDMALLEHPHRDCIYEEAKSCVQYGKSSVLNTWEQMTKYKQEKFPTKYGLTANRMIFRKHNEKSLIDIMDKNWEEFNSWKTKRDQLNFMYTLWKNNYEIYRIFEDDFYTYTKHKHEKLDKFGEKLWYKLSSLKKKIVDLNIYKFLIFLKG